MSKSPASALDVADRRGALPILRAFVRAYPARSATALVAVFVAGLLDGLGLSMLLSMLTLAAGQAQGDPSLPERVALGIANTSACRRPRRIS